MCSLTSSTVRSLSSRAARGRGSNESSNKASNSKQSLPLPLSFVTRSLCFLLRNWLSPYPLEYRPGVWMVTTDYIAKESYQPLRYWCSPGNSSTTTDTPSPPFFSCQLITAHRSSRVPMPGSLFDSKRSAGGRRLLEARRDTSFGHLLGGISFHRDSRTSDASWRLALPRPDQLLSERIKEKIVHTCITANQVFHTACKNFHSTCRLYRKKW